MGDVVMLEVFENTQGLTKTQKIAKLNDMTRQALGVYGKFLQTQGISALPEADQSAIREKLEKYDDFSFKNDPHQERDFGAIYHNGIKCFWKIDYYNKSYDEGSPDPSDPTVTRRVLTLMLAEEY